jgi:putative DNA primase/helicase
MTNLPDRAAIRAHLAALYATADDGSLAVWHAQSKATAWVPVADLDLAAATIARIGTVGNAYLGVGLHPEPLGRNRRGDATGVCAIPGLFVEIDVAGPGHKAANLTPDTTAVGALVREAVPVPPTYVLHSGGGIHAYWLFREVWHFANADEHRQASRMLRALQWLLIAEGRRRGWQIDNTSDLSRVLRPAGTVNRKPGLPERPVRVLVADGPRYAIEDLERILPLDDALFPDRPPRPTDRVPARAPAAHWSRVVAGCGYMRHCQEDAAVLSEPEWHSALTIVGRCVGGADVAHRISAPYPDYDPDETSRKFAYAEERDNPVRCDTVRRQRGGEPWCSRCPWWGRISSPIQLGYARGYRFEGPGKGTGHA